MRKRQRISIDFNVRKPKLQINHSISRNVNKKKGISLFIMYYINIWIICLITQLFSIFKWFKRWYKRSCQ